MVRFAHVYRALASQGINFPPAAVKEAFSQVDQASLAKRVKERYRYEVWDGVSPVNGVPADRVRQAKGLAPGQAAYMIYIDDRLVIMNGTHFRTGAPLDAASVEQAAQEHIDFLVEQALVDELVDELIERI